MIPVLDMDSLGLYRGSSLYMGFAPRDFWLIVKYLCELFVNLSDMKHNEPSIDYFVSSLALSLKGGCHVLVPCNGCLLSFVSCSGDKFMERYTAVFFSPFI